MQRKDDDDDDDDDKKKKKKEKFRRKFALVEFKVNAKRKTERKFG